MSEVLVQLLGLAVCAATWFQFGRMVERRRQVRQYAAWVEQLAERLERKH